MYRQNPDNETLISPQSKILHILFWVILFLFYLTPYVLSEPDGAEVIDIAFGDRILRLLFRLAAIMGCAYFLALRILPRILWQKELIKTSIEFVLGVYLICVVSRFSVVYLLEPIQNQKTGNQETAFEIFTQWRVLFQYYFVGIFAGTFPFLFFHQLLERQQLLRHQLKIQAEKKTAELAALKSQLNPHFLFNTLNNMYSLAVQGSPMTAVSIEKLSGILDYLLYRCVEKFVPLNQEITLLNNYISLEKLRYNNRLSIEQEFSIDSNYLIAPLILLTMVENMFKHGVEKTTGQAILKIKISATNGALYMLTENTFDPHSQSEHGIGLKNVCQQLKLLYPGKHQIESKVIGSIYRTQLKIVLA